MKSTRYNTLKVGLAIRVNASGGLTGQPGIG
jgi:hypothetical protein